LVNAIFRDVDERVRLPIRVAEAVCELAERIAEPRAFIIESIASNSADNACNETQTANCPHCILPLPNPCAASCARSTGRRVHDAPADLQHGREQVIDAWPWLEQVQHAALVGDELRLEGLARGRNGDPRRLRRALTLADSGVGPLALHLCRSELRVNPYGQTLCRGGPPRPLVQRPAFVVSQQQRFTVAFSRHAAQSTSAAAQVQDFF
jgi:hypothetical protein